MRAAIGQPLPALAPYGIIARLDHEFLNAQGVRAKLKQWEDAGLLVPQLVVRSLPIVQQIPPRAGWSDTSGAGG